MKTLIPAIDAEYRTLATREARAIGGSSLGGLMTLYATFELAPPIGWISSRDDQIMAGLFMKMGGGVILWTAITIIFFRWFAAEGDNPLTPIRAES